MHREGRTFAGPWVSVGGVSYPGSSGSCCRAVDTAKLHFTAGSGDTLDAPSAPVASQHFDSISATPFTGLIINAEVRTFAGPRVSVGGVWGVIPRWQRILLLSPPAPQRAPDLAMAMPRKALALAPPQRAPPLSQRNAVSSGKPCVRETRHGREIGYYERLWLCPERRWLWLWLCPERRWLWLHSERHRLWLWLWLWLCPEGRCTCRLQLGCRGYFRGRR